MHFFDLLMRSMGQNVKFIIEHVCEGDDFTAGVNWHLGNYQLPFSPISNPYVLDQCNLLNKRDCFLILQNGNRHRFPSPEDAASMSALKKGKN